LWIDGESRENTGQTKEEGKIEPAGKIPHPTVQPRKTYFDHKNLIRPFLTIYFFMVIQASFKLNLQLNKSF